MNYLCSKNRSFNWSIGSAIHVLGCAWFAANIYYYILEAIFRIVIFLCICFPSEIAKELVNLISFMRGGKLFYIFLTLLLVICWKGIEALSNRAVISCVIVENILFNASQDLFKSQIFFLKMLIIFIIVWLILFLKLALRNMGNWPTLKSRFRFESSTFYICISICFMMLNGVMVLMKFFFPNSILINIVKYMFIFAMWLEFINLYDITYEKLM